MKTTVTHPRNARLFGQVGQGERGQGSVFRRLDDAGAPGGEGRARLSRDHGVGEVPGRDHGGHADRLLHDHYVLRGGRRHDDLG